MQRKDKNRSIPQRLQEVVARQLLAKRMGQQYGGKRDLYTTLGYPMDNELTFDKYYEHYERQPIARAVIDRPVEAAWESELFVATLGGIEREKEDLLSRQWNSLSKKLGLTQEFIRLDKLVGLGKFAILLLGFNDVNTVNGFEKPVSGSPELRYVRAFPERDVDIQQWVSNPSDERYGWPEMYQIKTGDPNHSSGAGTVVYVHYSRVIHVSEGSVTSNVYGTPRLKPIINRLYDLEKLLGGSAEMYWKGARPGYYANIDKDAEMDKDAREDFQSQMQEYEHDLLRFMVGQGIDINSLDQQISDPMNHIDVQLQAIASQKGFPKRILIGAEQGDLASRQDRTNWLNVIKSHQELFCVPKVVEPFVDRCIKYGILPSQEYIIKWEDIFSPSLQEKVDIGKARAQAIAAYAQYPTAAEILDEQHVYKFILGLTDEQIEEVKQTKEETKSQEEEDMKAGEQESE